MAIGVSTALFYPEYTEIAVQRLADAGVSDIEIFFNSQCEYEISFCRQLKKIIDRYHMNVISAHAFCIVLEPYLFNEYDRRRGDAEKIMRKLVGAASFMGAKYYTFHGNQLRATTTDFDYEEFGKLMSYYADICGDQGIELAWENVSWCQSSDPAFIKNALQYIDSPHLKFTFDFKQAHRANRLPEEYLEVMWDKLVNVHINDYDNAHDCLLPGQGTVDFHHYFELLSSMGYQGNFIIEVYRDNFKDFSEVLKAKEFLLTELKD